MQLKPVVLALALIVPGLAQAVTCQNNLAPVNPSAIYTDHGNGTVTDTRTGLMWKKCLEGRWGNGCAGGAEAVMSWNDALGHAQEHIFAGHSDWRLPNLKELRSLVEECRKDPAINGQVFPGSSPSYVWSSSPHVQNRGNAWSVNFYHGDSSDYFRNSVSLVRLVRTDPSSVFLMDEEPVNGECGGAAGVPAQTVPSGNLCRAGAASDVTRANGVFGWQCLGTYGGSTAQCLAPQAAVSATGERSAMAGLDALPDWLRWAGVTLIALGVLLVLRKLRRK